MGRFDATDDERGQVGIGTLIIFIAMVLVAAVAAGVLINTAGLLESRAADTGADVQAEVSNQIDVISASGNVNQVNDSTGGAGVDTVENGTLEFVNLTVKKSPGSDDIDLTDATVDYISDANSTTLTWSATGGASHFTTESVGDGGSNVLNSTGQRIVIAINASAIEDFGTAPHTGLEEGGSATIRIVDQSGAQTIYGVNVPDTISDEAYVEV